MTRAGRLAFLIAVLAASASLVLAGPNYAVVVSAETAADPDWQPVVAALQAKYDAEVYTWREQPAECQRDLGVQMPRYTAFVARPSEAGRDFVAQVHRLTRALDDDPYGDTMWGIITGYVAQDALRMVGAEPLVVRRGLAGTSLDLTRFQSGAWYDEGRQRHAVVKRPGAEPTDIEGPADPTLALAQRLREGETDLMLTSGHATERDWQVGYGYPAGQFRSQGGVLLAVPREGAAEPINSANAKVYLALGNCLMGHMVDRDAMMAAWLHSGGVNQAVGYTVVSWFGYMGWGVGDYFIGQAGRYSLAESFFANQQALLWRLVAESAARPQVDLTAEEMAGDNGIGQLAGRLGYKEFDAVAREHVGLLWDRDTVALYGDPAWDARLQAAELGYTTELARSAGRLRLVVRAQRDVQFGRPLLIRLDERVSPGALVTGAEFKPVMTDDFVMLPGLTNLAAGSVATVEFEILPPT